MYCRHFMTLFGDIMKICIIGKSKRFDILKNQLKEKEFSVTHYESADCIPAEIIADYVVLPIPTLNKHGLINIENNTNLTAEALFSRIQTNTVFISCNYSNANYNVIDINSRDDFAFLNAVPTAEGAIAIAINRSNSSLFDENILITGFGRVAKILADRLKSLGCRVTIAARSLKDLSFAKALGFKTIKICNLKDEINGFDLLFQTVPVCIISKEVIECITSSITIIELSSKSLGTDVAFAEQRKINIVHAPALPEKIAPISAGNILTESVLSIIEETSGRNI